MNLPDMQRCACGNLRKTTRAVTQFYDRHLRSTGLRSTQCALLRKISLQSKISVCELGALLLMGQSTVTRNVDVLRKPGFITITPENHDARKRSISSTQTGRKKLADAIRLWQEAQAKIEQDLGERFDGCLKTLQDINRLIKEK